MEKSTKPIVRIVFTVVKTGLAILAIGIVFGFVSFVIAVDKQRSCEWANIDNIELHAHVDIPKVTSSDCAYDQAVNTKKARFTLDLKSVDLEKYIHRHQLKKVVPASELTLGRFLMLAGETAPRADYYYKQGAKEGENWAVLLDKNTGKLWVTIQYKD